MKIKILIDWTSNPVTLSTHIPAELSPWQRTAEIQAAPRQGIVYALIVADGITIDAEVCNGRGAWLTVAAGGSDLEGIDPDFGRNFQLRITGGEINGLPVGPRGKFTGVNTL